MSTDKYWILYRIVNRDSAVHYRSRQRIRDRNRTVLDRGVSVHLQMYIEDRMRYVRVMNFIDVTMMDVYGDYYAELKPVGPG